MYHLTIHTDGQLICSKKSLSFVHLLAEIASYEVMIKTNARIYFGNELEPIFEHNR